MPARRALVVGAGGQLGRALTAAWPDATGVTRAELDLADPASVAAFDFSPYGVVVNAAAYTAVDAAETPEGRREAWAANVSGVAALVAAAREHRCTLVHISSDYVFDGTREEHPEDEPFSPLGVYGQTKAAGDALVATLPQHYVLRTSWVIGDGKNFVATMASLADRGVQPGVVGDQDGRLTFTSEIARAVDHLLAVGAPSGTYNLSGAGEVMSWADIARAVFNERGRPASDVRTVTTAEYGAGKELAPRPRHSALALDKIRSTGFEPAPVVDQLSAYLRVLP
jgi:dTDP-4-dehydrorhamnose 3,5-epimerase/reductase